MLPTFNNIAIEWFCTSEHIGLYIRDFIVSKSILGAAVTTLLHTMPQNSIRDALWQHRDDAQWCAAATFDLHGQGNDKAAGFRQ